MAYSTVTITNVGSPPDDPLLLLGGRLWVPDPELFPGPYNCAVGTVSGLWRQDLNLTPLNPVMIDLVNNGYLCLSMHVRKAPPNPLPGQTTTGQYRQQQDDLQIGIQYMRNIAGYDTTGFLASVGGSASAYLSLWWSLEGVEGNSKVEASINLSPVTDMSDRQSDVTQSFIQASTNYANTTDLGILRSYSPISLNLVNSTPILHYQGNAESMPLSQGALFNTAMSGNPNYTYLVNTGQAGTKHSFDMWPYVNSNALFWLASAVENWEQEVDLGGMPDYHTEMKTYRVVIVDGLGSTTQNIKVNGSFGMQDAINIAIQNRPYSNAGLISVTATIL